MSVTATVDQLLEAAKKLKSSAGNEANTKALLIEPLLASLGWDPSDLDQVEREYRVFDGTFLDYALKIDGKPRLFIEAKAIGVNLDEKSFIAQTVNYANNAGVLWCVLTNGTSYRVYKTNEPVGMEEKLLFEVDLTEASAGASSEVAKALQLLGFPSLSGGELEEWGERVFVDKRVRKVLAGLAADPPTALLEVVAASLGKPAISSELLRESLVRILDVGDGGSLVPSGVSSGLGPVSGKLASAAGKEYALDHHLSEKPAAIVDLFEQIDEFARSLGANVSRRVRKQYVGYFSGKRSFCTTETQRQRVIVYLNLNPTKAAPWNGHSMRDVREIGHFGMGDTEFSLRESSQLTELKELIKLAYVETSSGSKSTK
jgi:predicted transport protein